MTKDDSKRTQLICLRTIQLFVTKMLEVLSLFSKTYAKVMAFEMINYNIQVLCAKHCMLH